MKVEIEQEAEEKRKREAKNGGNFDDENSDEEY
jgi:hypothetical protein